MTSGVQLDSVLSSGRCRFREMSYAGVVRPGNDFSIEKDRNVGTVRCLDDERSDTRVGSAFEVEEEVSSVLVIAAKAHHHWVAWSLVAIRALMLDADSAPWPTGERDSQ